MLTTCCFDHFFPLCVGFPISLSWHLRRTSFEMTMTREPPTLLHRTIACPFSSLIWEEQRKRKGRDMNRCNIKSNMSKCNMRRIRCGGARREGGRLSRSGFITEPWNVSTPASLWETSVCPSERERERGVYCRGRRRPGDHPIARWWRQRQEECLRLSAQRVVVWQGRSCERSSMRLRAPPPTRRGQRREMREEWERRGGGASKQTWTAFSKRSLLNVRKQKIGQGSSSVWESADAEWLLFFFFK